MNRIIGALVIALLQFIVLPPARVQSGYPSQQVAKIVVPFAPGANTDLLARMYAQAFTDALGSRFIVENKPGGGTNIAAESVARAAPDGLTLFVAQFASHAANRWLYGKLAYDPIKDFAGIGMMAETGEREDAGPFGRGTGADRQGQARRLELRLLGHRLTDSQFSCKPLILSSFLCRC